MFSAAGTAARLCLVTALAALTAASPLTAPQDLKRFKLEDLIPLRRDLFPVRIPGHWISETQYIYMDQEGGGIRTFDVDSNTTDTLLTDTDVRKLNHTIVSFSKDGKHWLLASDFKKVYRFSSVAKYYVYEVESGSIWPVGDGEDLQTCVWSPGAGGARAALAYVRDNDVHYAPDAAGERPAARLTSDGLPGQVYNGVADWIYEEEILNSGAAMWFSTEGSYLAVASFNDTLVESASFQYYGAPSSIDFQYPVTVQFKYPKAGRTNPTVSLRVFSLGGEVSASTVSAPVDVVGADHILGSVTWATDRSVVVLWLNRRQNVSALVRCNMDNNQCKTERIQSEPNGWIDISEVTFDSSGERMVDVSPQPSGAGAERSPHAVLADRAAGTVCDLTPGNVTVVSVLGWVGESDEVYYLAAPSDAPWERQVWAAACAGDAPPPRCVSCGEPACRSVSATFAPGGAHAFMICSATNIPPRTYIYDAKTSQLTLWHNNDRLAAKLSEYALPRAEYTMLQLHPGVMAHVRLLLPPDFDPATKYPMVLKVYAGPGSTRVLDKYELEYSTYLASNSSFVVCYVDVRGSGAMGTAALHAVNNALGTVEVDDTLQAIRVLVNKYTFIDESRIGVWGWSYGGYTAALMLAHDSSHLLRCAAAIAPVTSWLYYDSIYTERYMGLPGDNPLGYKRADLLQQASKLRGRKLLLVHGNADDNVHYQHSTMLSKVLQHADIDFEQMSYPDENHSLAGVSRHFYHTLNRHWSECFK